MTIITSIRVWCFSPVDPSLMTNSSSYSSSIGGHWAVKPESEIKPLQTPLKYGKVVFLFNSSF